jgi:hypothetical protein
MVLRERCAGVDVKSPSGFQQFAPLDKLLEIDSRNASGLQVSRAQQPSLFRQFQQLFYVVLWHAAILHNVSRWQQVNTFSKYVVGWVSPVLDGARITGGTACCDLAGDLAGDLATFIKIDSLRL